MKIINNILLPEILIFNKFKFSMDVYKVDIYWKLNDNFTINKILINNLSITNKYDKIIYFTGSKNNLNKSLYLKSPVKGFFYTPLSRNVIISKDELICSIITRENLYSFITSYNDDIMFEIKINSI